MFPANIKNIIFDFGGVIYDIAPNKTIEAFKLLGINKFDSFDKFLTMHADDSLFTDIETGKISPDEFRASIKAMCNFPINDRAVDFAWNAMLVGYVKERLDLLIELKSKYRIFLLSNTNRIHWEYFSIQLKDFGYAGLHELFEKTYYSHEMGMKKPDIAIFQFVLKDSGLINRETLFLDDNSSNVSAALAAGIPSIRITKELDMLSVFERV